MAASDHYTGQATAKEPTSTSWDTTQSQRTSAANQTCPSKSVKFQLLVQVRPKMSIEFHKANLSVTRFCWIRRDPTISRMRRITTTPGISKSWAKLPVTSACRIDACHSLKIWMPRKFMLMIALRCSGIRSLHFRSLTKKSSTNSQEPAQHPRNLNQPNYWSERSHESSKAAIVSIKATQVTEIKKCNLHEIFAIRKLIINMA